MFQILTDICVIFILNWLFQKRVSSLIMIWNFFFPSNFPQPLYLILRLKKFRNKTGIWLSCHKKADIIFLEDSFLKVCHRAISYWRRQSLLIFNAVCKMLDANWSSSLYSAREKKKIYLEHLNFVTWVQDWGSMVNSIWKEPKVLNTPKHKSYWDLQLDTNTRNLLKSKLLEIWEGILVLKKTVVYLLLDPKNQNSKRKFLSVTMLQVYHIKLWSLVLEFQKENALAKFYPHKMIRGFTV